MPLNEKNIPEWARLEGGRLVETIWNLECYTPSVPDNIESVDGYGDPRAKFTRTPIPSYMNIEPSQVAEDGSVSYTPLQLQFIKDEVRKCYYTGHWFFNRGKLTWLTPWQYMGLNYWRPALSTPDGFMEYRNRQRKLLHFCWNVYQNEEELGVTYLKGRQEGATTWAHLIAFWLASRAETQVVGLSSYDYDLAEKNFQELLSDPVKNLPIWLIPVHRAAAGKMEFEEPPERITKNKKMVSVSRALRSRINLEALTPKGWDGRRLNGLVADEGGKWTRVNITTWWAKQQRALMENGRKRGFAFLPTTTDEGDKGGANFKALFEDADISTKQNGKYPHTTNLLRNLFLPADEGHPGWSDEWGNDIIDYPDDEQWAWMQKQGHRERIGSRAKLMRRRQQILESGNDALYAEEIRQNPFTPADSFNSMNQHCPFDVTILQDLERAADTNEVQDRIMRGWFYWKDPKTRTEVGWRPDRNGPMLRTWEPPAAYMNKVRVSRGVKGPTSKAGALGLDPYLKASTKKKGSNLAITGKLFYNRDYEEMNRKHFLEHGRDMAGYFPTPSIFLEYVFRSPDPVEDMEQLLMAAVYYSMPIAPEENTLLMVNTYFSQMGYGDFLLSEAQMLNEASPKPEQFMRKGVTTGGEGQGSDVVRKGATYFNEFLRGNALYLGDHTYDIAQQPMRYPFLRSIRDNKLFDISDRTKSDATMSCVMVHFYEYNTNDYSAPLFNNVRASSTLGRMFPKGTFLRRVGGS